MIDIENWDWEPGKKDIADLDKIRGQFGRVDEFTVSPDGDKIAAVGRLEDDTFTANVNGENWSDPVELLWHLRYIPDGRLIGLGRIDDQWTLLEDGKPWEERFEYLWNPKISANGKSIAAMYKRDNKYGIILNGKPWEQGFQAMRHYDVSPDGEHTAATIQTEALKEADIFGFFEGVWSIAVDGKPWATKFVNTWSPTFSHDGKSVAAEARTDICDYTVAIDSVTWSGV